VRWILQQQELKLSYAGMLTPNGGSSSTVTILDDLQISKQVELPVFNGEDPVHG